ncbi:MAG: VOC family protein [Mucilaginibacter sp.]
MKPRFNVLTLGVTDLQKSLKFYHEGLGFPTNGIIGTEFEHGSVVFFDMNNGMKLALYAKKDLAWDARVPESAATGSDFSIGYLTKDKTEVDSIMKSAKSAGATITKPAQKAFWGGYSGYFRDPDGHLWEIAWNPQLIPED